MMLHKFMKKGSFKLAYMDTDSILMGLTEDELDDCVKPEMRAEWESSAKPFWFAGDSVRSQKIPGMDLDLESHN